jgi:hypothetical protein
MILVRLSSVSGEMILVRICSAEGDDDGVEGFGGDDDLLADV